MTVSTPLDIIEAQRPRLATMGLGITDSGYVYALASDPVGSMCLGCEQGPDHHHIDAEDGPRLTCCAHLWEVFPELDAAWRCYRNGEGE